MTCHSCLRFGAYKLHKRHFIENTTQVATVSRQRLVAAGKAPAEQKAEGLRGRTIATGVLSLGPCFQHDADVVQVAHSLLVLQARLRDVRTQPIPHSGIVVPHLPVLVVQLQWTPNADRIEALNHLFIASIHVLEVCIIEFPVLHLCKAFDIYLIIMVQILEPGSLLQRVADELQITFVLCVLPMRARNVLSHPDTQVRYASTFLAQPSNKVVPRLDAILFVKEVGNLLIESRHIRGLPASEVVHVGRGKKTDGTLETIRICVQI
jgi:hypothetical protein